MKKVVLLLMFLAGVLFAQVDFQTATKDQLMAIKGIGAKKAEAIMDYRKTNKIKSADDLVNIKGFGEKIVAKIKANNM